MRTKIETEVGVSLNLGSNISVKRRYFSKIAHISSHNTAIILRFADAPLSKHIFGTIEDGRFFAKKRQ